MILLDSQADIVQTFLILNEIGLVPDPAGLNLWPIYVGFLPDAPGIQDNALCVYATVGTKETRLYQGDTVEHPGIQIKCRSVTYKGGWSKLAQINALFDSSHTTLASVPVVANTYQIAGIHRRPILSLGQEDNEKRRFLFTMNALCTINTTPYT